MESTANPAALGAIIIAIFIPVSIGMWVAVTGFLTSMSGWSDLADTFPARERPKGETLKNAVFKVGSISLFRFRRPPVLVPWNRILFVESQHILWKRSLTLDVGGITTMRVHPRVIPMFVAHGVRIPQDAAA